MSEAVRGEAPPGEAAAGEAAAGVSAPAEASSTQDNQQDGKATASTSAEEDEQFKYHQQMLYPTPGLRNYGFSDQFMMFTFKVGGGAKVWLHTGLEG